MRALSSCFPLFLPRLQPYLRVRYPLFHRHVFSSFGGALRKVPVTINSLPDKPIYQWQEEVEVLENYTPGGLHPVHLEETYNDGRYRIVHKLGHGSFSTVWLAWDELEKKLAALKILRADASEKNTDSDILDHLAAGQADHPGRSHIVTITDRFFITGPNGHHRAIVTETAGFSVGASKDYSTTFMFPPQVARAIGTQFLQGLSYIHSRGVVHGDLHPDNVLLKHPSLASLSVDELYECIGKPERFATRRLDDQPPGPEAPRYGVPPACNVISAEEVTEADVIIINFGEAFTCGSESRTDVKLRTPLLRLPPEAIFNEGINQAADIWTAAGTLYEILGERALFEAFKPDEDHVVAEMVSTMGRLPDRWWSSWSARRAYFLEDGSWDVNTTRMHEPRFRFLDERLRIMGRGDGTSSSGFTPEELAALEGLLRLMLTYDPVHRATAQKALGSTWVAEYGLPALESLNAAPPAT